MTLIEWIAARCPRGMKRKLAIALHKDASTVTRMLQPGGRRPQISELKTIEAVLGEPIPLNLLFGDERARQATQQSGFIDRALAVAAISEMLLLIEPHGTKWPRESAETGAALVIEAATVEPGDTGGNRTPDTIRSDIAWIVRTLARQAAPKE